MPSFSLTPLQPFPPPSGPFPSGTQFQDETVNVGPPTPRYVSFNGPGVQATYDGANGRVNVEVSTGAVEVLDEGVVILPAVRRINFVGDGVTATAPSGSTDTVNVAVPGATGGGGGPVPLFRLTRPFSNQNSGSIVTYQQSLVFNPIGTVNMSGGYYETTVYGCYYFTAFVPFSVPDAVQRFGIAIAEWPDYLNDPLGGGDMVTIHAQHVVYPRQTGSPRDMAATLHTGPLIIQAGRRIGVVAAVLGAVINFGSSTGTVTPISPFDPENPTTPAVFSGEYLPWEQT